MVAPVTGPFVRIIEDVDSTTVQSRYRQRPPFNIPLPYTMSYTRGVDRAVSVDDSGPVFDSGNVKNVSFSAFHVVSDFRASCYNRAYEKLRGELSDTAGWSENIAQAHLAREMFNDRASQLWSFTKRLSRRDFIGAARALRTPVPSGVSHRKAISQNFLEFHFGWEPLVNDIRSSMDILSSDPGERKISGKASHPITIQSLVDNSDAGGTAFIRTTTYAKLRIHLFATVRVDNPNLFLANQLGLLDLALPWKLVPFSFLVDWFVNVEQMISSVSDWFGCTLIQPGTTAFARGSNTELSTTRHYAPPHLYTQSTRNQTSVELERSTGISGPALIVKPFKGLSVTRGATAIALVLSVLGK